MKRIVYIAVAAVALAACTKTEVSNKSIDTNAPIAFTAYNTNKPAGTKAMIEGKIYTPDCPTFMAKAFYLDEGKTWAADSTEATSYMPDSEVKWNEDSSIWITDVLYYWPKSNGSLTFMAYTPASISDYVSFNKEAVNGVEITEAYNVEEHQDVDFMVADIMRDLTYSTASATYEYVNEDEGYNVSYGSAVQALFRHKLSQIAGINISTDEDYSGSMTITLTDVVISGQYTEGTYEDGEWKTTGDPSEGTTLFSGEQNVTKEGDSVSVTDNGYYLTIPQDVTEDDDVYITITYTVTSDETSYDVTTTIKLSDYQEAIEEGTKYTYDLIIGKDSKTGGFTQIIWAPTVEEWVDETPEKK